MGGELSQTCNTHHSCASSLRTGWLQVQELDARSLKKLLNALDKKATENLQLRAKFQGDPMK